MYGVGMRGGSSFRLMKLPRFGGLHEKNEQKIINTVLDVRMAIQNKKINHNKLQNIKAGK